MRAEEFRRAGTQGTGIRITAIPRVIGIPVTAILPVTRIPAIGAQDTEIITPAVKTITRDTCLPIHNLHTDMGRGNRNRAILEIRWLQPGTHQMPDHLGVTHETPGTFLRLAVILPN